MMSTPSEPKGSKGRAEALPGRPVIFGEVVFDLFPDGSAVLGGAPLNVTWHLRGFGLDPLLITSVGDDDAGRQAIAQMRSWGIDTSGVQVDAHHPTGRVNVRLLHGQPRFEILPGQAYDFITTQNALAAVSGQRLSLLHHGTLIQRSGRSRATLDTILRRFDLPVFVDLNLRDPWWSIPLAKKALSTARWAKLNQAELAAVSGQRLDRAETPLTAMCVREDFGLELLVVTLGGDGAFMVHQGGLLRSEAASAESIVDTVGAGDAFDAVVIVGLMQGWPFELTLKRAVSFAGEVCRTRGATSPDRALYLAAQRAWRRQP